MSIDERRFDMRNPRSRRIVIDASVIRSAGDRDSPSERAKDCRKFMERVLVICHRMVMTPSLQDEWKKHRSRFARIWRIQMESRKKVVWPIPFETSMVLNQCASVLTDEKALKAAMKDLHLIEAALSTDGLIVSLDEVARGIFSRVAQHGGELTSITWVNPQIPTEMALDWLEHGAKAENTRMMRQHAGI